MSKRGYHHGNLRQALVEAALDLIEAKGPTGFTLSEAAKQAGVTPAAVYRHFDGREQLIAEAARQGYEIFAQVMKRAYDSGQPSALAAFEATGRRSVTAHSARQASAARNVFGPYLGSQPWCGRIVCSQLSRHGQPLSTRRSSGNGYWRLLARAGPDPRGRINYDCQHTDIAFVLRRILGDAHPLAGAVVPGDWGWVSMADLCGH